MINKLAFVLAVVFGGKFLPSKFFILLLLDFNSSQFYKMCFYRVAAEGGQQEKAVT